MIQKKDVIQKEDVIRKEEKDAILLPVVTSPSEASSSTPGFMFKGNRYDSYEEMVKAKRNYNKEMLAKSGLLEASAKFRDDLSHTAPRKTQASQRGLRADRKRKETTDPLPRRKSSRIAGVKADGVYIEDERAGGRVVIGGAGDNSSELFSSAKVVVETDNDKFYNDRVNDGSDLSINDAVELCGRKWVKDDSVEMAEQFVDGTLGSMEDVDPGTFSKSRKSVKKSISTLASQVEGLSVDNKNCVAKVVPDRIYSVAFHPSSHKLIATAGDKKGFVGLWDIDASPNDSDTNGVHLFKPHNGAVNNLEWNKSGKNLLSLSYDGTIRLFDVNKQSFIEAFSSYDDSCEFKDKLGYGMDEGRKFYTQYACFDHRNEDCLFLSTSVGGVAHIDLRNKKKTFDMALGNKKVNTVSLHPNGYTLATAGLDCEVNLWDIRKFKSIKSGTNVEPIATQRSSKSINSAFFSPSGKNLLTTTMSDTLDLISDCHLQSGLISKPTHRIRHDNRTGRWLSTLMAQWHPAATNEELFIVGSMSRPRRMEFFNGDNGKMLKGLSGEFLTAVVSRCCYRRGVATR